MWDNLKEVCVYLMVHAPFSSYVHVETRLLVFMDKYTIHTLLCWSDMHAKRDHEAVHAIMNDMHRLTPGYIIGL